MRSTTKSSKKRELSPTSNSVENETPKRLRRDQSSDTPDHHDPNLRSRPPTRSTSTPLRPSSQPASRKSSTRKSVRSSLTIKARSNDVGGGTQRVSTPARKDSTDVSLATTPPSEKGSNIISTPNASSYKSAGNSTTTRRTPRKRAEPSTPVSRLLPRVEVGVEEEEEEPHPTTCTSPTPVVATGISDVFCEADVECTSRPDAEVITASSLTLFVRLARSLVVFTTLLFAFTSLVRLDHDKHDTHGSISRSGRKMYSFLTLGIVRPWEWGVPRQDVALLAEAEGLLLSQKGQLQQLSLAEESTEEQASRGGATAEDLRAALSSWGWGSRQAAAASSTTGIDLRLSLAELKRAVNHRAAARVESSSSVEEARITDLVQRVEALRNDVCTTDRCQLWADFYASLGVEMTASELGGTELAAQKASVFDRLSEKVKTETSHSKEESASELIDRAILGVDSECEHRDAAPCLVNILVRSLDSVLAVADLLSLPAGVKSDGEVTAKESVRAGMSLEGRDSTLLEVKVLSALLSEEVKRLVEEASEDSPNEGEVYNLSIGLVKKILNADMTRLREDIASLASSS